MIDKRTYAISSMAGISCRTLSIIIINWNTINLLRDCLDSIFNNIGSLDCEVIVVDNGSSDGSQQMVESEFHSVILIANKINLGFAAANNQGLKLSKGRYILFLNSDTVVLGDVLQKSVSYLETNDEIGAMGCRVLNTDGSVQLTCSMYPSVLNQFLQLMGVWKLKWPRFFGRYLMTHWARDTEREVEVISGCFLLSRRDLIVEIGLFDENFYFFGEETDWCFRAINAGWKLKFAPVGEIIHHGGASAIKLNYKRDVLLTRAKVQLHRKHNNVASACLVWIMGLLFNFSRALYWTFRSIGGEDYPRKRALHFAKVCVHINECW